MAPAIRVEIEKKHIDEAVERAKAGVSKEESYYYGDRLTPGLQLRVQGRQAFWALKYFNFTKTIGYAYPAEDKHLPSVSAARKLAAVCKDVLDDDPKMLEPMLVKYYGGADRDVKKAKKEMVAVSTGWTVEETAEAMIAARTKSDTDDPIKKATVDQFRLTLRRPQVKALSKKPIADVTKADLDAIKREMDKSPEGASMIKKFVSDIRSILTWGATHATDMTCLDPEKIWWESVKSGKKVKAITRTPTVDDLIKTLILAEKYLDEPLPGRFSEGKNGVGQNVLNGLWWLVLSSQRTTAGTRLRLVDFFPDPKRPDSGWYLAFWAEGETKNGKAFVLPVPPRAVSFVKKRMEKARRNGDSQWCFPSSQEQGKSETDIPVDRGSPGGITERLAVRDTPTRKTIARALKKNKEWQNPYVDLLAENSIMYWSPHDVRRTLVDILEEHGIPGGASAVLAHEVRLTDDLLFVDNARNREQYLELRVSRVTKLAYGAGGFIPLKSKAMEVWTNVLLDRYEELHPTYQRARKIETAERVLRAISSDASQAEQARARAMEMLPGVRKRLEAKLLDHEQMLASLKKKTPAPVNDLRTALVEIEIAKADLEAFHGNPASYAIEASRANGVRGIHSLLALPTEIPVDLEKEAPAYTELRDSYISGQIDYDTFRSAVVERYPITLDAFDDRTFVRPVTGDEVL